MYSGKASELSVLRFKQVDSLRQYFPTVKELQKDAVYEIPVLLPTKYNITIRITIGANFPNVPPDLKVYPDVSHRLIDSNMNIRPEASSKLQQWHVHQNLGKTMYSIVQKLMQDPPTLGAPVKVARTTSSPQAARFVGLPTLRGGVFHGFVSRPSSRNNSSASNGSSNNLSNSPGASSVSSSVSVPPVPSSFPDLQHMKPAQLGELLNDDAAFKLYLNNIEGVQTMRSLRDELRASQQGDSDTADLDQQIAEAEQQLADNKARLSSKLTQQDKIMSQLQVSNLVEALTDLAHEIEEETDELARDFLDGDLSSKDFQKTYCAKRQLYHLRSAKKESLLIKQQREAKK